MEPPSLRGVLSLSLSMLTAQTAVAISQVSLRCYFGPELQVLNVSASSTLASVKQQLLLVFGKPIAKIRWKDSEGTSRHR